MNIVITVVNGQNFVELNIEEVVKTRIVYPKPHVYVATGKVQLARVGNRCHCNIGGAGHV